MPAPPPTALAPTSASSSSATGCSVWPWRTFYSSVFRTRKRGRWRGASPSLVRRDALARVATDIGLAAHLMVSESEDEAGGRDNPSLLADTCEAVIAALYLDGGLAIAAEFVRRHWQPLVEEDREPPKDAKTELQEWAQGRGLALPSYRELYRGRAAPRAALPRRSGAVRYSAGGRLGDAPSATPNGPRPRPCSSGSAGMPGETTRCGFVAVLGAPNAGKSTLVNHMVGVKVSIVSAKVQTTRVRVLGIFIEGRTQIVLIDTPGIFVPRRRLDRAMVAAAWGGAADADERLLLVDSLRGVDADTRRIIAGLEGSRRAAVLVLNKVDLVNKPSLLDLAAELGESGVLTDTFMVSARSGNGVGDLVAFLAARMPEGPWHFPEDQISDMPQRLYAAEITREKLYLQLRQELPYAATVETESWTEKPDGSVRVGQVIFVERPSQKAIVLGREGRRIKALGETARAELEEAFERRVHLILFVKVRKLWGDDAERYREWGLDFDA